MDIRILSLISCLGPYMTAEQNQTLSDIGRELAEVTRERDEALKDIERWQHGENEQLAAAQDRILIEKRDKEAYFHQGVAALAREQQLREACEAERIMGPIQFKFCEYADVKELLATQPDDGPLKEYVAKERAKMLREIAETHHIFYDFDLRRKADELKGKK